MPIDISSSHPFPAAGIGLLADANCLVLCLDGTGRITFLNAFALAFFGFPQDEIIGLPVMGTLFPLDTHCNLEPLNRTTTTVNQTTQTDHHLCASQRKNGERAWTVWSSQALATPEENTKQYLWIGHDVTDRLNPDAGTVAPIGQNDRLQATATQLQEKTPPLGIEEKKRLESQDLYQLFSAVTTEGILFHENGIALEVNDVFVAMAECPRDQIIGMDIVRHFISPRDITRVQRKMASDDDQLYEVTARSLKGRLFPVELRSCPGTLAGRPCRVVSIRDISQRKKTERQIIQSQKMEAIGNLASGIAHDFNNMLAGIQGNVEVIRHQLSPRSPHQKGLSLISQIVERGAKLSGQILGYARGGQSELTEIDLNQLVEDTLGMFGSAHRHITIQTHLMPETPVVKGDRTQIEQVLLNLFINAIQAMPMGGELTIETKPTVLTRDIRRPYEIVPGDYAMLVVNDTGHGMDEKTRKMAFEPFFTTKAKGQGTGLGLASTYGIIKNHKGYIDVSSEPGVGSRFSVLLPATARKEQPTTVDTTMEKGARTILMVDDEKDFLLLGHQMLNLLGYRSITAGSCDEAITRFDQSDEKIALVIMDMIMPNGSVDETIQRFREIDTTVRILLTSGHSQDGEAGRKLMQHCDGFIQKPFRLASLSQKIKELIGTTENEDQ